MHLVQITPGTGGMYCGNCFRDNALVAEWRRLGHETLMVPLYLPLTLDEPSQAGQVPVFFGGINVYLQQKSALFRRAPLWLRRVFDSPALLRLAAGRAAKTRARDVGELTVSMLRGEEGNQARELEQLVSWLRSHRTPDIVCLSNALLIGLARQLKQQLGSRIVCNLQGEDSFLDSMPSPHRELAWQTLSERASDVDLFIAPSHYFAGLMAQRLGLASHRIRVVPNGISLDGFHAAPAASPATPTLGYFARMCPEKGLDMLVDAFLILKQQQPSRPLRLRVGGGCGPADRPFVNQLQQCLRQAGVLQDTEFLPNLDRNAKLDFLHSLSVFSVPARYGEAFGLYLLEALAAGIPVVQPRTAAFPEILEATGGGLLCEPNNAAALADAIDSLLNDPTRAQALGQAGRQAVEKEFSAAQMATRLLAAFEPLMTPQLQPDPLASKP
jgi:glycosyltransferase involved in cell wall biosynthesis